jgi:hypothetical protein
LTAKRRDLLEARLAECGGLAGWGHVLNRIRGSPWLQRGESGWQLTLKWLLDETNLAEILEGQHDDNWQTTPTRTNGSGRGRGGADPRVAAFAAAAARRAARGHR